MVKARNGKKAVQKESSSAFFARTRPKFLDWTPPTPEEQVLAAQQRSADREEQTKKVIALEKARQAKKSSERKKLPAR